MPGVTIGGMSEQDLVGLIDRRVGELVTSRITDYNNSEGFRQRVISIVEPAIIAIIATTGKIVET